SSSTSRPRSASSPATTPPPAPDPTTTTSNRSFTRCPGRTSPCGGGERPAARSRSPPTRHPRRAPERRSPSRTPRSRARARARTPECARARRAPPRSPTPVRARRAPPPPGRARAAACARAARRRRGRARPAPTRARSARRAARRRPRAARRARSPVEVLAREPERAARIERFHLRPREARHVRLDREAEPGLQVGQVAVPDRERLEARAFQLGSGRGIHGQDPVQLVDRLPEHEPPAAVPLLEEVVEAAGADDVALDALNRSSLRDRHLRLRDRAGARDLDRDPAEEVEDPDAALEALAADADEVVAGALEPGRHHPAVVVPERAEAVPV